MFLCFEKTVSLYINGRVKDFTPFNKVFHDGNFTQVFGIHILKKVKKGAYLSTETLVRVDNFVDNSPKLCKKCINLRKHVVSRSFSDKVRFLTKKDGFMIIGVRFKTIAAALSVVCFLLCLRLVSLGVATANAKPNAMCVVIDAGHGGIDGGAIGVSGVKESDLNLLVAYDLKDCFENAGFKVVMTRKDENGLYGLATDGFKRRDMSKRKEIINSARPVVVVSVHMNKSPVKSRRGAQVCCQKGDADSLTLANVIQHNLNEYVNTTYTGRAYNIIEGDYYICDCSPYPSVIIECGFLSNVEDERLLSEKEYRRKIAYLIYEGAAEYVAIYT